MATSFIKSFMEAVNPATAKATKRAQNPQDPTIEGMKRPETASNARAGCDFQGSFRGAACRT